MPITIDPVDKIALIYKQLESVYQNARAVVNKQTDTTGFPVEVEDVITMADASEFTITITITEAP